MNREEAKKLLPIIQAYAEGKNVQVMDADKGWIDVCNPLFNPCYLYRIKPELLDFWIAFNRFGDYLVFETEVMAKEYVSKGQLSPYAIHHVREVEK